MPEPAIVAIVAVLAVVMAEAVLWVRGRLVRSRSRLAELAGKLGLAYEGPDLFGQGASATGLLEGVRVDVSLAGRFLEVAVDEGPPEGVRVASRHAMNEEFGTPTGDDDFDHAVETRGTWQAAIAALDHETRAKVRDLCSRVTLTTEFGKTTALVPAEWDRAEENVRRVVGLARHLARRPATPAALIANLAEEPVSSVRRNNFFALVESGTPHEIALGARAALRDEKLAPLASIFLPERLPSLLENPESTAREIAGAGSAFERAALTTLAARGPLVAPLVVAVWKLEIGKPDETAAVSALGECADVDVVTLLRERQGVLPTPLRAACEDAIAKIQARAAGTAGTVSLVEDERAGSLSLSRELGAVSLAKPAKQ